MRTIPFFLSAAMLILVACSPLAQQTATATALPEASATPVMATSVPPAEVPAATVPATVTTAPTAPPTAEPTVEPVADEPAQADIVGDFMASSYRTVAVVKNPFAPSVLIIAGERAPLTCGSAEEPQRCWADELCGSMYTSRACYFFVEPTFDAAADPQTRFVAQWPEIPGINALVPETMRFVDGETVEFTAPGGDGGFSVEEVWQLNLTTGDLTLVSRVEQSVDTP